MTPALEIVGDWTHPRLLVRLLHAIDSPWILTERGLEHAETGERCSVVMRGADPALPAAFRRGDDPLSPSLTDAVLTAIEGHHSVLRVTADPAHVGMAALEAVVRCTDGLVNAGGIAVWCPVSGAAHEADRFQDLVREWAAAPPELRRQHLRRILVRPLVAEPACWRTDGLGLFEVADAACARTVPDVVALELFERALQSLGADQPDRARIEVHAKWFTARAEADERNPYGRMWWTAEGPG